MTDEIRRIEEQIEKSNYGIAELEEEVRKLEECIERRRTTFNEIASRCEIEWFRNSWMRYESQNLIEEIKYWLR